MSFDTLGLSAPILQAVKAQGYDTPSPIQQQAIPAVLAGHDVMAAAQTGTGKTAGFTLPILERLSGGPKVMHNHIRALILTPTRELAAQVADNVAKYSVHLPLTSAVVFGGVKINPQMICLRKGVDILIATPGRLLDLHQQNAVKFDQLEVLVLDEADRMLDMGFINDIRKIMSKLPKQRQNLMFSATFSPDIRQLAKTIVHQPVEISVAPANVTATNVKQWLCPVDKKRKPNLLIHLFRSLNWGQTLVFSRTKHGANRLTVMLDAVGIKAAAIHSNKSQGARTKALDSFKKGEIQVLVATDIAARGIDIDLLPHVVNFDLPNTPEDYVHRIGRTGRAGASGEAVSLVCADEHKELVAIERVIGKHIEREYIGGFEPVHELPASPTVLKPVAPKKPKKIKMDHRDGQRSGENAQGHKPSGNAARRPSNTKKSSGAHARSKAGNPRAKPATSANPKAAQSKPRRRPSN